MQPKSLVPRTVAVFVLGTVMIGCAMGTPQRAPPPVGDAFISHFACEGVSLERKGGDLVARVMDEVAIGLDAASRVERARDMAQWLWARRGSDSGITHIIIQLLAPGDAGVLLTEFRLTDGG
jgi:hypothetical protein